MNITKITNHQLFALTASYTCGSAILAVPAPAASQAKQDAWISILITLVFGLLEIWFITIIWNRFPDMTLVEIMQKVFGKWIGSAIGAYFAFFCLLSSSQVIWYIGNFITLQAMPETPSHLINTVFFAAISIAVLYGIEVITRSYEIFIYLVSILFILSVILVSPNAKIENLLPIFEKGIGPILKGSVLLSSYLTFPAIVLLMVFPDSTDNTRKARKPLVKGYLWGGFLVSISILFSILVLGSTITARSQYPLYVLAKEINVGGIFTRLEFIVAAIWIITVLSRGLLYFYAGFMGMTQLLGFKNSKRLILPLGLIVLIMSGIVYKDVIYQSDWDTYVWPPFSATFGLILPIVMIVVFFIKDKLYRTQ